MFLPGIVALACVLHVDGRNNLPNPRKTCPPVPNLPDADHDGVPDACDNCIDTANPLQRDFDKDHIGDAYVPCGVRLRFDIDCAT